MIEIVRGLETDEATVSSTLAVARRMGMDPVLLRETPGAITSRIQALLCNEAFRMLGEELASAEEIDRAIQNGLGLEIGPLALADRVGLEARLQTLEYLHKTLGETYRPASRLQQLVKNNRKALVPDNRT